MKINKYNFPSDEPKSADNSVDVEKCPSCNSSFSEHSNHQIVQCALKELRKEDVE